MHKAFAFHFGSGSKPVNEMTDIHSRECAVVQLPIPSNPSRCFTPGLDETEFCENLD